MTEQEFKQQLDQVITAGLNTVGVSVVYAQLSVIKQFVEVVYDASVVETINRQRMAQAEAAAKVSQEKSVTEGETN